MIFHKANLSYKYYKISIYQTLFHDFKAIYQHNYALSDRKQERGYRELRM